MQITKSWLEEKQMCSSGLDWFSKQFGETADYQAVLNKLAEIDNGDWASWLISKAGAVDTTLEIKGDYKTEHSLFFAGKIIVTGTLQVKFHIEAGEGIEAGWGIEAGEGIKAGEGIEAGSGIEAGRGIVCGLFITCKKTLKFSLRVFAGVCWWREISDEEKTITCGKLEGGKVAYGIVKEVK